MTGTDPDADKQRPLDSTQAYRPTEAKSTPPLPDNLPKIPGITLHYEIARGGMGVVYSGRQDFLDRRVAVKLLSVELGGEAFVQRFQREAKILAGVKHANIVACHLAGTTDDGQSYLVMEFIDGPSLKKWVSDHGPLSVPAALRMTRAIAHALGAAHQLGIIHRDVKPENILLETVTSTALDVAFPFTPKVVDLGLARASSGSASLGLTSPGSVMGTPSTMSPEQYDEPDAVDFRTDIYGLGCVLFEMLVGVPAYRAKKLTDIVALKRAPFAPNPCTENPDVPAAVGTLVQDMLATSRDDRPGSYRDLDERLDALLNAIAASARAAKTQPPVGSDTGATIVSKPNPAFPSPPTRAPANAPPPGTKGPGLLRTAEINFLAEGLGEVQAAGPPPSAFRDSGIAPPSATSAQVPPANVQATAPLTIPPTPPPDLKKKRLLIGGAIAVVAVIGIVIATRGGGGPKPDDDPEVPPGTNRAPTVAIKGPENAKIDLKKSFTLTAEASDPDRDALSYTWSCPDDMLIVRGASSQTARFEMIDGLPDLEAVIRVEVRDAKKGTATAEWKVSVGSVPEQDALVGFDSRGSGWQLDQEDRRWWVRVQDPGDPHVSCRALQGKRDLSASLGSEPFWEWFGSLASDEEPMATFARLGLRFEFGERAWAVVCSRTKKDGLLWVAEVMEPVRSGAEWELRPLPTPKAFTFWQPEDTQDDYRVWFSVQRRGRKLSLQVGEARMPADGSGEQVRDKFELVAVDISEGDVEPKVTLFVEKGRGLFRVYRR